MMFIFFYKEKSSTFHTYQFEDRVSDHNHHNLPNTLVDWALHFAILEVISTAQFSKLTPP